jgi:CheY-like chemotaxis protein
MLNVTMDVPHILLAADDPDFALLIQLGFHQSGILNPIHVVSDGRAALSYLNGEGQYSNRISFPLPALLLIDARLRHVQGFEVLRWIRQRPVLSDTNIVLFSSLGSETDARLAEEVGAGYYLLKPFDFQDLVRIVQQIGVSWLQAGSFPQMTSMPVGPGLSLCSPSKTD